MVSRPKSSYYCKARSARYFQARFYLELQERGGLTVWGTRRRIHLAGLSWFSLTLTTAGMLIQLFEERSQGVEFRAKAAPIPGFQPRNSAVIVAEGLACSKVRRARGVRCGWRARKGEGRRGFLEEGRQRLGERLLHDHTVAIGGNHPLELGQLAGLRPEIEGRDIQN